MRRIVDLTSDLYDGIRGLATEPRTTYAADGYNTTTLHLYSHAGTHMDAPLHFVEGGNTIDHMPLDQCVGEALVVPLMHKGPDSLITVEDLELHADRIGVGSRVLLRTDWSLHLGRDDYRSHLPRISAELAHFFAAEKIALVGVETPSVASVRPDRKAELTEVHQILLRAGIAIVEGLANLDELTRDVVHFIALPLKIRGCDGSPVRAIAIEE